MTLGVTLAAGLGWGFALAAFLFFGLASIVHSCEDDAEKAADESAREKAKRQSGMFAWSAVGVLWSYAAVAAYRGGIAAGWWT